MRKSLNKRKKIQEVIKTLEEQQKEIINKNSKHHNKI